MGNYLIILFLIMASLVFLFVIFAFLKIFVTWIQCFMSGKQTSAIDIVGMHMRRSPVKLICEQRIRAGFVGTDVSVSDLEKAHLQGIDIKKLVDALCLAKRTEQSITWEQLVATELDTANLGRKFSGNSLS